MGSSLAQCCQQEPRHFQSLLRMLALSFGSFMVITPVISPNVMASRAESGKERKCDHSGYVSLFNNFP